MLLTLTCMLKRCGCTIQKERAQPRVHMLPLSDTAAVVVKPRLARAERARCCFLDARPKRRCAEKPSP